jgi:putative FmdB family regulatory protein
MPIYEYESDSRDCPCGGRFEQLQKLSDEELRACPRCAAPVRRVISAPAVTVGGSHLLKEGHFSKHGFTQYKKVGGGVYEKTAGDGPRYISDDGK